jgi:selenide,water dikinase
MAELAHVLRPLLPSDDPNALVDVTTGDDAAVYLLDDDDERAIAVTLDFFTPMVDDPGDFGRIAAANALSDLYAMGARPRFALNLLGFPRGLLGEGIVEEILAGGAEIARRAGIPVLGGHSIDDPEPKYGMVAIGEVARDALVTNAGARAGDVLVLTKAVGTGVVTTALKNDAASPEEVAAAVASMTTLNAQAARAMRRVGVDAATDVTGFGLLGHLRSLLRASGCAAVIRAGAVPLLPGARQLAEAGQVPGGTKRNRRDVEDDVIFDGDVNEVSRLLLCDAQTSGGLLMAVAADRCDALTAALAGEGVPVAAVIGRVVEGAAGAIHVEAGS